MASRPLPQISTPRLRNFLGARTLFAATVTATVSLQANGIKLMLRRGKAAGLPDGVHLRAHQFRHTLAHTWRMAGGDSTDLMRIMGWRSPEMRHRYGASAADERAHQRHRQLRLGDRF